MKKCILASAVFFFTFSLSLHAANPNFGRYIGVLHHKSLKKDQLVRFELIPDKSEGEVLSLIGLMTLHFGDFKAGKYITYRFNKIRYNMLNGAIIFDPAEKDLIVAKASLTAGELKGTVISAFGEEEIGEIELRKDRAAAPKYPLLQEPDGMYYCKRNNSYFQLYSYYATSEKAAHADPYGVYEIKGRLIKHSEAFGGAFASDAIKSGTYNFFNDSIVLWGEREAYECKTDGERLQCGGLVYVRMGTPPKPLVLYPPGGTETVPLPGGKNDEAPAIQDSPANVEGQYFGYVHHEQRGEYQAGGLNLTLLPTESGEGASIRFATQARLFLGNSSGTEFIPYNITELSFPVQSSQLVLSFKQIDSVIVITSVGKGVVQGVWYSSLFGRVGTFEFYKRGVKPLNVPDPAKVMSEWKGDYYGKPDRGRYPWVLRLVTGFSSSTSSSSPSGPIRFGGYLAVNFERLGIEEIPVSDRFQITGGTYDIYTGTISLELGEGALAVGKRLDSGTLRFEWFLTGNFGARALTHSATFRRYGKP